MHLTEAMLTNTHYTYMQYMYVNIQMVKGYTKWKENNLDLIYM